MSPDAEVQILISAIDNMSVTLKKIEATLGQTQASVEKQTEATTKTFDKQMGSLLVLGDAANKVDNIFTSYQNLQLRLENASERVANAQDRLIKAQQNLREVTKKAGATAEDYADAQRQVEMASRSLQISQNNQARMNNMVIGTYINMSIQAISLSASFGTVKIAIIGLTKASLAFIATPIGATLVAIGTALSIVTYQFIEYKKVQEDLKLIEEDEIGLRKRLAEMTTTLADETSRYSDAIGKAKDQMRGIYGAQSEKEAQALVKIAEQESKVADLKAGRLKDEKGNIIEATGVRVRYQEYLLTQLKNSYDAEFTAKRNLYDAINNLNAIQAEDERGLRQGVEDFWKLNNEERIRYLTEEFNPAVAKLAEEEANAQIVEIQKVINKLNEAIAKKNELYGREITKQYTAGGQIAKVWEDLTLKIQGKTATEPTNYEQYYKHDFISRPGQPAIDFSPDDTIIGMKNASKLGGMTINITGNIYGTNPREIAKALSDELRKKVSI